MSVEERGRGRPSRRRARGRGRYIGNQTGGGIVAGSEIEGRGRGGRARGRYVRDQTLDAIFGAGRVSRGRGPQGVRRPQCVCSGRPRSRGRGRAHSSDHGTSNSSGGYEGEAASVSLSPSQDKQLTVAANADQANTGNGMELKDEAASANNEQDKEKQEEKFFNDQCPICKVDIGTHRYVTLDCQHRLHNVCAFRLAQNLVSGVFKMWLSCLNFCFKFQTFLLF